MKLCHLCIPALVLAISTAHDSAACSRVVYDGDNGIIMIGRTLDWRTPIPTNLYVYPRGIAKTSMSAEPCLSWRSKYASVIAVGYDGGVTEGMNETGLTMNGLFCKGTVYPIAPKELKKSDRPVVSLSMIVSYFLDNYSSVDDIEQWLNDNPFYIAGATFDGGTVSTLHWAVTDSAGVTLMIEYQKGKMNLYKGKDLKVLTNDPPHPQMQAIETYWQQIGGENMLPGGIRSSDRFVRASYFINQIPTGVDYDSAFASISSIMGDVAVPFGYEIEGKPNLSSTQWTSIADATEGKYYFHFATSPGYLWIDMSRLALHDGAPILKLDNTKHRGIIGNANKYLEKSPGFTPMW